ncbi:hypothetical protein GOD78_28185 [Sinorhizobium medicae]|nr:hypothetical protein [Sinorhizobium medicae]MDX0821298.1 hypothetical protein [Sinorhizobium medicae]MDX0864304.1 hypothetical protein [Sinorhizobium medicae]
MDQIKPTQAGMLRTNLRNQIRQTPLPKWKALLPLFEAVMNSFQAVQDSSVERDHRITIEIERDEPGLFAEEAPAIKGFVITDTGIGFDDDNFESFNTAFSDHKYERGGKGLGRFMWLKAFDRVHISSVFQADDDGTFSRWKREFEFDFSYDPEFASLIEAKDVEVKTVVRLEHFRQPYREECPREVDQLALRLAEHFILVLMNKDCPSVDIIDGGIKTSLNDVYRDHFAKYASGDSFTIRDRTFTIHGFRLTAPRASKHKLIYAANSRGVLSEMLDKFVPNLSTKLQNVDGKSFAYLAVVQGDYLNDKVNNFRTDFEMSEDTEEELLGPVSGEIRRSEIRDASIDFIEQDLANLIATLNDLKTQKIMSFVQTDAPQYKPLLRYLPWFIRDIAPNASKTEIEFALHRELHRREVALKKESGKILVEAAKLKDYDGYRDRLAEFLEQSNELGASALAQYVMHRKIVLELFDKALSADRKTEKYPLEEAVHNILFPMRSTDRDALYSQHNLWMIDERLTYHWFLSSDKPLKSHEEFDSTSALRPDLFIFDRKIAFSEGEEGQQPVNSLVVVEFKRPQRDDYSDEDNPLQQVLDQIRDIRKGQVKDEKGRPIALAYEKVPTFAYIICDITPSLREVLIDRDAQGTPDGLSYYGYHKNHSVYFEVIDYAKLLMDAKKRNRVFFDKLNLMGGKA